MKTLILGNKDRPSLASHLGTTLNGTVIGRKHNGIDMTKPEMRNKFSNISLDYDCVIFCAYAINFSQNLQVIDTYNLWNENNKEGRFIIIGSSCDRHFMEAPSLDWFTYPIEKYSLQIINNKININYKHKLSKVFSTLISPHHMNTKNSHEDGMDPSQVAKVVKYSIDSPIHIEKVECSRYESML